MRAWLAAVLLALLLGACAPRLVGFQPGWLPSPEDWGPHPAPLEWWYVSAYLPRHQLAFHWAFFKVYVPESSRVMGLPARWVFPRPFHDVHLAITDLAGNRRLDRELEDFPDQRGRVEADPLRLELDGWRLEQTASGYRLLCPPYLNLELVPLKPAVLHPPGYSGSAESGRMYYVSYTRMGLDGEILGRPVSGFAWMDHQWGDQGAGREITWDWFGLMLSDWTEVMIYRMKERGRVTEVHASLVDASGRASKLAGVSMAPSRPWTSPRSGYRYYLDWEVAAPELSLSLSALRAEQEFLGEFAGVAYWEGPVAGRGLHAGSPVEVWGMGELVGGRWPR